MQVASSTLCNLLLNFSPCKEPIVSEGALPLLVSLTRHPHANLRLNGVWGLMVGVCVLVSLTRHPHANLRLNGVWGLMVGV